MTEARLETEWDRTASIMAMVSNVQCTDRSKLIRDPSVLNPVIQAKRRSIAPKERMTLKELRRAMEG